MTSEADANARQDARHQHEVQGGSVDRAAQANADEHIALGHSLEDAGDAAAALGCYETAARLAPRYARARMNIGNALQKLRRRQDAMAAYREAVACEPAFAPARFNLGALLIECGHLDEGATELRAAVQQQPELVDARLLLADAYEKLGRAEDADEQFAAALRRAPDHAGALLNFGTYCLRQGRFGDASELLRRARVANPELDDVRSFNVFALNFRSDVDAETIAAEHKAAGLHIQRRAGEPFRHWTNVPNPDRRLRIGYVSGDFAHHPVALFLRPVLEQQKSSTFETLCYSNVAGDNEIAAVLRGHAHHWREIAGMSDTDVANLVRDDGVDILVDLSGHTTGNRLGVFALHPAPVQVTWLGYLNTTGLAAIDYRITDRHTDPPGTTERLHSERLVRMPDSQWCYAPWHRIEPVSAPHSTRPDALVFGSFNQAVKITDATLTLWSRILAALPAAELVVLDVRPITETQLRRRMAAHGIDASRVTLVGRVDIDAYFAAIGDVDIALDTMPYNGATTTLDTLWMGVPIVALRGDRGVSRGSYSILRSLGADELIASTADEYVDLNVRLAVDVGWRKRLRATLHDRLIRSPLMDAAGFTSALGARFVEMWRAWCAGQR